VRQGELWTSTVDGRVIGEGRPGKQTGWAGELYLQQVNASIQT